MLDHGIRQNFSLKIAHYLMHVNHDATVWSTVYEVSLVESWGDFLLSNDLD